MCDFESWERGAKGTFSLTLPSLNHKLLYTYKCSKCKVYLRMYFMLELSYEQIMFHANLIYTKITTLFQLHESTTSIMGQDRTQIS
jgi:hypothetical protein